MTRRKLQDYAERYMCAKHYQSLMTRAIASVEEHETADLSLQKRMRSLHWVSARQLEAPLHVERSDVRAAVERGITCTCTSTIQKSTVLSTLVDYLVSVVLYVNVLMPSMSTVSIVYANDERYDRDGLASPSARQARLPARRVQAHA